MSSVCLVQFPVCIANASPLSRARLTTRLLELMSLRIIIQTHVIIVLVASTFGEKYLGINVADKLVG